MTDRQPCAQILASARDGPLYAGVTSNLVGRVMQHRAGTFGRFTSRYGVHRLVWHDGADTMAAATAAEKRIKRWPRAWKIALIERANPARADLSTRRGLRPSPA